MTVSSSIRCVHKTSLFIDPLIGCILYILAKQTKQLIVAYWYVYQSGMYRDMQINNIIMHSHKSNTVLEYMTTLNSSESCNDLIGYAMLECSGISSRY